MAETSLATFSDNDHTMLVHFDELHENELVEEQMLNHANENTVIGELFIDTIGVENDTIELQQDIHFGNDEYSIDNIFIPQPPDSIPSKLHLTDQELTPFIIDHFNNQTIVPCSLIDEIAPACETQYRHFKTKNDNVVFEKLDDQWGINDDFSGVDAFVDSLLDQVSMGA
jgi:hypothetical protein